ncbi:Anti-sigma-B factor antagonist [Streptomyces sp. enrichment culture]|uniref:STAS domain-containing protein n=1 Tax=Streptomyces sp. enrichment culture TaxID=1795815 RepID=UPI003F55B671
MTAGSALAAPPPLGTPSMVHLSGELDLHTAAGLEPALAELADSRRELMIDLSDVTFCDSSGINLFLRLHHRCAAASGRLRLCRVPRRVALVFRMFRFHHVVPCTFV